MKERSKCFTALAVLLACCLLVTGALATDYLWTNGSGDGMWPNYLNWSHSGPPCLACYPSDSADNAAIPLAGALVLLVNEQINDLLLVDELGFEAPILLDGGGGGGGTGKVLTCSTVTIDGGSEFTGTTVHVTQKGSVETQ